MTAAPASGSFTQVDQAHVAAVGPAAALLFARVCWRAERDGSWKATRREMCEETGLTSSTLRGAVQVLRDLDWVRSERASADDATLVWTPVLPGHVDVAESAPPPCEIRHLPDVAESAISSTKTVDTTTDPPAAAAAVQEAPAMTVPDSYQDALLPTIAAEPAGPPKTAQTLVARWCDGHRESFGRDAAGPLVKRVAGQMRNMAKGCSSHDDWVAAYAAAYDAGRDGRWDAVGYMSRRHPVRGRTTNVFARPELGGTGTALDAVSAMLNTPQTPQLGGR